MSNEQEGAEVFKVELGVGKPARNRIKRKGRGFSRLELNEAGSSVLEARKFSIPVDSKRKSMHDFNISVLKELLEEERASSVRAELEKEAIKEEYQEFTQIRGIGLSSAETLVEMGITSVEELAALEVEKLETDIPTSTIKRWVRNAKKHLGEDIEELEEEELEELEELEEEIEELEATELTDLEAELEEIGTEEEKEVEEISEDEVSVTEKE
ncbi:MAG: helix-hairpin-helix domain-containing protein, partial [Candidatus Sifarchaeia archaeon]